MFKRVVLFVATFAIIGIAFTIYQWGEDDAPQAQAPRAMPTLPSLETQPANTTGSEQAIGFKGAKIPPGESPKVTILDERGNAKIVFKAVRWRPVSDNAFHLTSPEARLLLPGGQLAYVWADEGEVELQRASGSDYNPKRGWLRGNVRIFVDRSKPEWREANLEKAAPEQHPEMMVKIWLDDVDFDLDLGRLETSGPISLKSSDGSIEGRGLEMVWNENDRQIRKLRIAEGKRATVRSGMIDFGIGGEKKNVATQPGAETQPSSTELASKEEPETRKERASKKPTDDRLQFQTLDEQPDLPKPDRVDTYKIEFHDNVVAEQKQGDKLAGRLKANILQLICDIGREERAAVEHAPASQPTAEKKRLAAEEKKKKSEPAKTESEIQVEWTGELVATPEASQPQPDPKVEDKATRFHVIAIGTPVELFDSEQGGGTCQRLEYYSESKQVLLIGTPENLVVMNAGPDRQIAGEKIFFDRRLGLARVEGRGHMTDLRQSDETDSLPECMKEQLKQANTGQEKDARGADISWSKSVQIEFALAPEPGKLNEPPSDPNKLSGYLRHAVFEGEVTMNQQGELIQADRVEAFFVPPLTREAGASPLSGSVNAEKLIATGNVRMRRGNTQKNDKDNTGDELACDRLEVEMTTDDTGRNVPNVGKAFGNVLARRVTADGRREIRTEKTLVLTLASVPRTVDPQERERLEAAAQKCGFTPDSVQWKVFETRLNNRRKITATAISAEGGVRVSMRHPDHPRDNFDLVADTLNCELRGDEEITKALIVGSEDRPAVVDSGDVYVKGPQISLDMATLSMEVPGAGRMRFMTRQDLSGRATAEPIPVIVDWRDRMTMRGEKNIGTFSGAVRAVSGNTTANCNELRIEFENLEPVTSAPAGSLALDQRWILKPIFGAVRRENKTSATNRITEQMRKRAKYLWAVGDAVIVSTDYTQATPATGRLTRFVHAVLPMMKPAAGSQPAGERQILSRVLAAGPQIGVNLIEEHFSIEGEGHLLVEDRRLPKKKASRAANTGSSLTPTMTALDGSGPSETLFRWKNSMSFLNKRNVAVFQHEVDMLHLSGSKMVYARELLASANLDEKQKAEIKSREAHLNTDSLTVQFDREPGSAANNNAPLSRVTRVQNFRANGRVLLEMEKGKQTVTGSLLSYNDDTGEVLISGTPDSPAQVSELDPKSGKWKMIKARPGEHIEWNQRNQILRTKGGSVLSN